MRTGIRARTPSSAKRSHRIPPCLREQKTGAAAHKIPHSPTPSFRHHPPPSATQPPAGPPSSPSTRAKPLFIRDVALVSTDRRQHTQNASQRGSDPVRTPRNEEPHSNQHAATRKPTDFPARYKRHSIPRNGNRDPHPETELREKHSDRSSRHIILQIAVRV